MTRDDLQRIGDAAHVGMCAHGRNALTGEAVDRLPPRLWEALRIELQRRYRNATGEEFAVLTVQQAPEPAEVRAIPAGWKLVPVEPRDEMVVAGRKARMNIEGGYGGPGPWEAMLAAAPTPEDAK